MLKIYEVANYFLSKGSMTHKKLQKLCYYAQVLYSGVYSKKLIDTEFEAWIHGPVSRELFFRYQGQKNLSQVTCTTLLSENEKGILDATFAIYGKFSGDSLEELTHREEPWIKARNGIDGTAYSTKEISQEDITTLGKEIINKIRGEIN